VTEILRPDASGIARGAALLRSGGLVGFATETVYGLGADASDDRAVAAIYEAKGRPGNNPLICHYATAADAFVDVAACAPAIRLAEAFWPGPLTMVLPRRADSRVCRRAGAGRDTLAVRVPAHPDAIALLQAVGRPLAAPSANRSGQVSPTTAAHVLADLEGRIDGLIDSGACPVGVESTVVDLCGTPRLLRPGGVTLEAIEAVIGKLQTAPVLHPDGVGLPSPGLLASHYAPATRVRLEAREVGPDEALLAFGAPLAGGGAVFNLSPEGDLAVAAANLFAGLHWLDHAARERGLTSIAVMGIPAHGLGLAIIDRLTRAAAPRKEGLLF